MKNTFIFIATLSYGFLLTVFLFMGCGTNPVKVPEITQDSARTAAQWVTERQGFIEDAVAAITRVAVYSSDKDTFERTRTIEIMKAIAGNVNALVSQETVNPDEIKAALKINEPYFGEVTTVISSLIQIELKNFEDNGYKDLGVAVLKAVSKGVEDGVAQ